MAVKEFESTLAKKYPAKAHAKRVAEYLQVQDGVIYLEAQKTCMIEDNDETAPFRQRRYFYYCSGCPLPDSCLIYDISKSRLTLFIPPIDPESVVWAGLPLSPAEALSIYDVDEVLLTTSLASHLATFTADSVKTIYAIEGQISSEVAFPQFAHKDIAKLKTAIEECRVVKDEYEVAMTLKANDISREAHLCAMRAVKSAKTEQELLALFIAQCIRNGANNQAYGPIFASGRAAATLHYVKNDQPLVGKLNLLLDAGAEYDCYASDITRVFPINGKFSTESKNIYEIVLRMQKECIGMLKAGVVWDDVHLYAHKIAIDGLLRLGILKGDRDEILKKRTSVAFFPHGLGHYLGMDTHDTGGHANYEDEDTMFNYLRVRGKLPEGSIITVEPGIYFCAFIIEPFLKDPKHSVHIDKDVLDRYWDVGGVRLEDNILIKEHGCENLTFVPKEIDEVEAIASGNQ